MIYKTQRIFSLAKHNVLKDDVYHYKKEKINLFLHSGMQLKYIPSLKYKIVK